ncbi:MAG: hypothetical protein NVV63_03880 [Opitutus sp.]|nr:hypothetical protein [Opitutus sp.]
MTFPPVRLTAAFVVAALASAVAADDQPAQELPPAAELPSAPPPNIRDIEQAHLELRLAQTEAKLRTALRSYSLLEERVDEMARESEQRQRESDEASSKLLNEARAQADKAVREANARLEAIAEELRHTQAQLLTVTDENTHLKTKLALVGSPPGASGNQDAPTRPHAATAAPVAANTPAAETGGEPATAVDITLAPAPPAGGGTREHVVALGENLARISELYYGTPTRWEEIFEANRDVLTDANVVSAGAKLRIP